MNPSSPSNQAAEDNAPVGPTDAPADAARQPVNVPAASDPSPPADTGPETRYGPSDLWDEAAEAPPDGLPAQLGRYRLGREIGRGGMGVVLRAHDTVFNRSLAIKVLKAEHK